jgi:hypothetical protein
MRFISQLTLTILLGTMVACGSSSEFKLHDELGSEVLQNDEQLISQEPALPNEELAEPSVLEKYQHLDPTHLVPTNLLEKAVLYFDANKAKVKNQNFISVIDFSKKSTLTRFFIINVQTGVVWPLHVSHGKGSDSDHDGVAEKFSNSSGSNQSSLGFYKTAETYSGNHGLSLRLDGLSSTNSLVRARAIVIHGADYVQESSVIQGRSLGCPAVSMKVRDEVINRLKGGAIIYAGLSAKE